jgi:hypothetical protein
MLGWGHGVKAVKLAKKTRIDRRGSAATFRHRKSEFGLLRIADGLRQKNFEEFFICNLNAETLLGTYH